MIFINHTEVLDRQVAVVEVGGPLNSKTSPDFEDYINELLNKKIHFILFNAEKVEFFSSEGIGVILYIQKKISERNGFLIIFNLSEEIKTLYSIIGFDKIFTIAESRIDAMEIMDKQIKLRENEPAHEHSKKIITNKKADPVIKMEEAFNPFIIECRECKSLVRVRDTGKFMCPGCNIQFNVNDDLTIDY